MRSLHATFIQETTVNSLYSESASDLSGAGLLTYRVRASEHETDRLNPISGRWVCSWPTIRLPFNKELCQGSFEALTSGISFRDKTLFYF